MTAKNRAALIGKLHTALKKHFKPAPPSPGRPLMEHVLYASLLEDTPTDLADEGFAKCEQEFFDWNEVRVTTVTELAEVLSRLPSANAAAIRLKKNLQSMFETFYNFDIDYLKKENLGKAVAKFEAMPGMTPFVLSYLVQHGLGGHAIPVDKSAMKIMWLAGIVSDAEAESGKVPGLERTIPKNRSIEFSSLLHQAGIAFQANPKDKAVWDVLLAVNKDAKALYDRPPAAPPAPSKKSTKAEPAAAVTPPSGKAAKPAAKAAEPVPEKKTAKAAGPSTKPDAVKPTAKGKPESKVKAIEKPAAAKPVSGKAGSAAAAAGKPDAASPAKPTSSKPSAKAGSPAKPLSAKKLAPAKPEKPAAATKKPAAKSAAEPPAKTASKKAAPQKPLSAKSGAAKPVSKKAESKPISKSSASDKLVSAKKTATSTNKKLTKQKPR
ncbi:MAG: hypothetical protein ACO1RT_20690 [Planctomycetaceae bacterium]